VNRVLFLLSPLLLAACTPQLRAITPAPPARVVTLDARNDHIELSEAVALALDCYRQASPCRDVHATLSNKEVATVYATHLSRLSRGYWEDANVSTMTLVGLKPGTTTLRVTAEGWSHDYTVTVVSAR